ncbi:SAV_2336 N-terminal domain-related protein [Streptomyces sp. NPDC046862]|uniref:SAV_2336 N-terminal domain-related protein n=1 Tax=Streptomyces sp. NPDC046862 TaxID=3154603 RepID=UPI003453AD83
MDPEVARALLDCDAEVGLGEILDIAWLAGRLPAVNSSPTGMRSSPELGSADPGGDRGSDVNGDGEGAREPAVGEAPATSEGGPLPPGGPFRAPGGAARHDMGLWLRAAEPAIAEMGGVSSRVPAPLPARWLPGRPGLGNALRPLRRTSPSPVRTVVDEELTAEFAAATGMVVPMVTAAEEPHYDLALVCDTGSSMRLWTPLMREMGRAAARFGAFRSVTVRWLDPHTAQTTPTPAGGGRTGLRTLLEPGGRRLTAFVTDGVGPGWHDGRLAAQVHLLAAHGPVVIVHLLPRHLWGRTGVAPLPVSFHPQADGARSGPGAQRFTPAGWSLRDLWPGGRPPHGGRPHAVPVVPLAPDSLNRWASLLTGARSRVVSAPAWVVAAGPADERPAPAPVPDTATEQPVDEEELLDEFDATATPRARRLLRSLAVVPLNLSTMWLTHLVTSQWRKEPYDPAPLAEVFFSGLLRPRPVRDATGAHEAEPAYEFVGDTRQTLLEGMDRVEAVKTFQTVSAYVSTKMGRTALAFPALLASPRDARLVGQIDPETRPFAEIAARLLRGLGPAYGDAVRRIEAAVAELPDTTGTSSGPGASGAPLASPQNAPTAPASPEPVPAPPVTGTPAAFPPPLPGTAPAVPGTAPAPTDEPQLREPAARQPRRTIAVLGTAHSGKTTFLAAASLAATAARPRLGRWNVIAESEQAEHFLVQQTNALAVVRRFPEATMGPTAFSYVFRAEVTGRRRPERVDFALDFCDVGGREYRRENYGQNRVLDAHLGRAGHLVILIDPVGTGPQAEFLVPHLERLTQEFHESGRLLRGRLPHHVAFCVTKFDEPFVFQDARRGNWVGQTSQGDPCVPDADAEGYIAWLGDRSVDVARARNLVTRNFLPQRVSWYAVSAIGFHRTPDGALNLDDCSNQTYDERGLRVLRGPARPLNVLEPLIALGRASGDI